MMKKNHKRVTRISVLLIVVAAILIGVIATPNTEASGYYASYIKELTDLKVNYEEYFNGAVIQPLADTIKDDEQISVIITLDQENLMDIYEQGDKTMSFQEFALNSESAAQLRASIAEQKK